MEVEIKQEKKPYHENMAKGFLIIQKDLLYSELSILETITYSYIKDKIELSKGNSDFFDFDENKYFCIIPNIELMQILGCGKTKLIEIKNKLENKGLIKQVRQLDKSNKIFANDYKIQ